MRTCVVNLVLGLGMTAALAACHSPSGGIMSRTGGSHTYYSTETMQKTITMIDTRSGEVFFKVDVPPGKQLTIDFDGGEGDDPVYRPDILRYEVMELGTKYGKLRNAMPVPNAASRRIDVSLRQGVQYAAGSLQRPLRTDEMIDRPEWWTPQGGPLPDEDAATEMYDD